jgi:hypothetical protein
MEYHGKLYGRIAGEHFDTGKTSQQYDDLLEALQSFVNDFETDYVMPDGRIVDNPSTLLVQNYKVFKKAIEKALN